MNIKLLILLIFISSKVLGQVFPVALDGKVITSLAVEEKGYPDKMIIAGTASGIYYHNVTEPDSSWTHHYFYSSTVSSVYIQQYGVGPADLDRIFVSIMPDTLFGKTLVYTYDNPVQSYWTELDSGLDKNENNRVISFAAFNYSGNEPPKPAFCLDQNNTIYKLENNEWVKVKRGSFFNSINTLHSNGTTLWGGGSGGDFVQVLYLSKSINYGKDWEEFYLDAGKICYSISSSQNDTSTIYAGLNGAITKTIDGGNTWDLTSLNEQALYTSIVINPFDIQEIFAGGKTINNTFVLYRSSNGGKNWEEIVPIINRLCNCIVSGINSMAGTLIDGKFVLFIGTDGNGIFKYINNIVSIKDNMQDSPEQFQLFQNYPNPFNPETNFGFRIANFGFVRLNVYDILGNEVVALLNEEKDPGYYEIKFNTSSVSGGLPSGVYFYRLSAGKLTETKKMILLR